MPGVELKVMDKLKEKQHAITTVESCTGGRIADLLTNVGGAAQVYWGSVVTYDGSLKSDWGVPAGSIKDIGTVTEQARHSLRSTTSTLHRMWWVQAVSEYCICLMWRVCRSFSKDACHDTQFPESARDT